MARFAPTQTRPDEFRAVHRVADRAFPNLRDALLEAFNRARASLSLDQIEQRLRQGQFDQVATAVDADLLTAVVGDLRKQVPPPDDETATLRVIAAILIGAARGSADEVPEQVRETSVELAANLNVTNPRAVERARSLAGTMVRQVSRESREAIRTVIADALRDGTDVPTTARLVRDSIGLDSRSARALRNYRRTLDESLEAGRGFDLRNRFGLAPARLPSGTRERLGGQVTTAQRRDVMVNGYRERLLRHRATTIARSESMAAANQGQELLWREMVLDGSLDVTRARRVWVTALDDRVCPRCLPMNGKTVEFLGEFRETEFGVDPGGRVPSATRVSSPFIGQQPPLHVMGRCTTALRFD